MNVLEIISEFRIDNYIDSTQLTNEQALWFLNRTYRDFISTIRSKVNEDYFYNEWKTDTVANNREYALLKRTDVVPWMVNIKWISVKYTDKETEYKKLRLETLSNLDRDLQRYSDNQPASDPFYIISDESIFIYPSTKEEVVDWLIFYWIWDPVTLTLASLEDDIKTPLEFQDTLTLWMIYQSYRARWMIPEKDNAKAEYEVEKRSNISELSDRVNVPQYSAMPDLTNLS